MRKFLYLSILIALFMGCGDGVASKGFIFRFTSFDGQGVDIAVNGGRYRL